MATFSGQKLLAPSFSVETAVAAFFNEGSIAKAIDRAKKGSLSKIGAYVMRGARKSLKYGDGVSSPGQPPVAHKTGNIKKIKRKRINGQLQEVSSSMKRLSPLREFLFFVYDVSTGTVVIGPARTNQVSFEGSMIPVTGTVPSVLEYGGTVTLLEEMVAPGRWRRRDLRRRGAQAAIAQVRYGGRGFDAVQYRPVRARTIKVAARPYMAPALKTEMNNNKLAAAWRDAVGANVATGGYDYGLSSAA